MVFLQKAIIKKVIFAKDVLVIFSNEPLNKVNSAEEDILQILSF